MVKKRFLFIFLFFQATSALHIPWNEVNTDSFAWPQQFSLGVTHEGVCTPDVVEKIEPLHAQTVSFALDWRLVEPRCGAFDTQYLQTIATICQQLKTRGIKPIITLFHNLSPDWFNALGGFEKVDNKKYFINYGAKAIEYLSEYVDTWMTFYQPSGWAFEAYFRGNIFPHKKNMQLALNVLKNVLECHVDFYTAIKQKHKGIQIGLSHQILLFEPYYPANPLDQLASYFANALNNRLLLNFFKSGKLNITIPALGGILGLIAHCNYKNKKAPESLDFLCLIYQSRAFMKNFKPTPHPDEIKTDYELFTIYPEGLYKAIKLAAAIKKPLYVTCGIGNLLDDHRELFMRRYLYVINKAIADGYPIQGYLYRSLGTWDGSSCNFGLYTGDDKGGYKLQPSSGYLSSVAQRNK